MKYLILLLPLMMACQKSSGGSIATTSTVCAGHPIVGTWRSNQTAASIEFNADCTGSAPSCNAVFTFPYQAQNTGSAIVTATSSNNLPGCITVGTNSCAYSISGNNLTLNCNNVGNATYQRY